MHTQTQAPTIPLFLLLFLNPLSLSWLLSASFSTALLFLSSTVKSHLTANENPADACMLSWHGHGKLALLMLNGRRKPFKSHPCCLMWTLGKERVYTVIPCLGKGSGSFFGSTMDWGWIYLYLHMIEWHVAAFSFYNTNVLAYRFLCYVIKCSLVKHTWAYTLAVVSVNKCAYLATVLRFCPK